MIKLKYTRETGCTFLTITKQSAKILWGVMEEEKTLNVLCLHFLKRQSYFPIGIEFFVVGRMYKDQLEMFSEMKTLIVAQLNPQYVNGEMVYVPWNEQEKTPQNIVSFWKKALRAQVPLYQDTLEGYPITDGQGKVLADPKDFPFYYLKFWLVEVPEALPLPFLGINLRIEE